MENRLLHEVTRNIEITLREDRAFHDITSLACVEKGSGVGTLFLKEKGVIAGLPILEKIAYTVNPSLEVDCMGDEGMEALPGVVAEIKGPIHALLAMERAAINYVQHATSIATETARYVTAVDGKCDILDTRKTLPCHRYLQKYAVAIGGGKNHRFHLADRILIKDNHLIESGVEKAIASTREKYPEKWIEVEVENEKMFDAAVNACPDAILLDNMDTETLRALVKKNKQGIYLEASGGIELDNIRSYAETGVNGISVGKLTHSVRAIDMSLKIRRS